MVFTMKKTIGLLVLGAMLFATGHAAAQSTDPSTDPAAFDPNSILQSAQIPQDLSSYDTGVSGNDIEATVTPENPGAYQPVGISLNSDLVDLRRYMISWYVDGTLAQQGMGKQNFVSSTKAYGQQVSIRVTIQLVDSLVTKNVILLPQDISTMWEAVDSYVPPFYQGKKLPAREGVVRIIAIPNFLSGSRTIDPGDLVYNWKRNDNVLTGASSYGQESILIKNNKLRPTETFEVTASTPDNNNQATAKMALSFYDPKILFYQKDPETGLTSPYSQSRVVLTGGSSTVVAQPYFFSLTGPNKLSSLQMDWKMNDNPITLPDTENPNIVTLKNPGGSGIANLAVSVSNPNTDFQSALNQLSVIFNTK